MQSPLLLWMHLALVCGTASRARDIRRFAHDPKPFRSNERPEGLEGLSQRDQERVDLANTLFAFPRRIFLLAASRGVLTAMENPSNAYFWMTCWVGELLLKVTTFETNLQVCMFGGSRDKWTKILAACKSIETTSAHLGALHSMTKGINFGLHRLRVDIPARCVSF